MSLYGMMRTGVSGMAAQSNRLATVADNIANSNTTGYKRAYTEFSSLLIPSTGGSYTSGGVKTSVRNAITDQGVLQFTSSASDLAIRGDGFFVVKDASGSPFLTRAGSFVPDEAGRLVNAAGFYLAGYSYANGTPSAVANGFNGLDIVSIADFEITAEPTTVGIFGANLRSDSDIVPAAELPTAGGPTFSFTHKTSLRVYDNLGAEKLVDIYFSKTADNEWQVSVFDQSTATSTSPGTQWGAAATLQFDPANGRLTGPVDSISFPVPNGSTVEIDLTGLSQFASDFNIHTAETNGSSPSAIDEVTIDSRGNVSALYKDGSAKMLYRIPLATVQSPDQLAVLSGNVFSQSPESGDVRIGFPGEGNLGTIISGALEGSNVDIAEELTSMIESQRNYTANSKVFQTGSDLLDVLVNLKR